MAQQISALTPIDPFPSRVLPQDRFDQAVRTNMSQLSDMVSELNNSFIPSVNTMSTQVEASVGTASTAATTATNKASEATTAASTATTKAGEASASATSAANSAASIGESATAAATAATTATNKASEATTAANTATTKASQAGTSATNAANSATAASTSATNAANSASTATTKASEAATAASTATTKASQASTSETNAANSATAASTSATNAANSATAAANSANAAATAISAIMVNSDDDGAASHNCFYRGKNLTNVYNLAQLSTKLSNGDFSDLYIGDYFTLPFTYGGTTKNINFRIAHLNYWKYIGQVDGSSGLSVLGATPNTFGRITVNHIVFIPDTALFNSKLNPANDTTGALRYSYLWQLLNRTDNNQIFTNKNGANTNTTDACVYTALNAANCMNGHILGHSDLLTTAVTHTADSAAGSGFVGSTTNWAWCDEYLGLCSEVMVYGASVFSSSGRDVGGKKSQLALFRLDPTWIIGRSNRIGWWLGAVASTSAFASIGGYGNANNSGASNSNGVRPLILFS